MQDKRLKTVGVFLEEAMLVEFPTSKNDDTRNQQFCWSELNLEKYFQIYLS